MIAIKTKPLSVNVAYRGRRFESSAYKDYKKIVFSLLPRIQIPDGHLTIIFRVGFSNNGSDIDNVIKPFTDILQKAYEFNDNRVFRIEAQKEIVKKGEEYISFDIQPFIHR